MRAKMAAAEVRHERFTPDGPEKEKHTRLFQHVAISDKDTVACGCTNTHRKAFFFFFFTILSELGSAVCVWRIGGTGREHRRTSNLNTDALVWK